MKKTDAIWCDRTLLQAAQFIGLCLTEKQYHRELRRLKVRERSWDDFLNPGAHATTHFFESKEGKHIAIVCLEPRRSQTLEQHYALLVHEASHIWQEECRLIGEKHPSSEMEAYSMQNIAQGLFSAYRRLAK